MECGTTQPEPVLPAVLGVALEDVAQTGWLYIFIASLRNMILLFEMRNNLCPSFLLLRLAFSLLGLPST